VASGAIACWRHGEDRAVQGAAVVTQETDVRSGELLNWFAANLRSTIRERGYHLVEGTMPADEGGIVLHPIGPEGPKSFRRRNRAVFVIALGEADHYPTVPLKTGYPLLLRTLANLFVLIVHNGRQGSPEAYFFTLEQGFYAIPHTGDDKAFFDAVVDRLAPLATSQLIIENDFVPDLPEELWAGDDVTASITRAGRHLDELDLLPSPFPLEEYLTPEDFRHVRQLFQIGGLSYGNLSARKDATTFWMSASGVDKSRLEEIGRDILLVTDFLPERKAMRLSVPPDVQPRRVSVDAIEHWMIYREHPEVGAILHVHAWMEGITSTHINYPCGTYELAETVAELVRQAPDPGHAVIGLKNHGLTITGESLDEIFARIEGQILRQVPMS
jgi:ribulose-5-phosphate 4-epimerase/fuculose-1-phosphate aldolase